MKRLYKLLMMFSLVMTSLGLNANAEMSKINLNLKDNQLIKEQLNTIEFTIDLSSDQVVLDEYSIEIKSSDEIQFKDVDLNESTIVSNVSLDEKSLKLEGFKNEGIMVFELIVYVNSTDKTSVSFHALEIKDGKSTINQSWDIDLNEEIDLNKEFDTISFVQPMIDSTTNLDLDKLNYYYDYYDNDSEYFLWIDITSYDGILPTNPTFPSLEDFLQEDFIQDFLQDKNIGYTDLDDWNFHASIKANSFEGKNIEGILSLPEGYEKVQKFAFNDNNITELIAPGLEYVGNNAFSNNSIKSFDAPKLVNLGTEAFMNNQISGIVELEALTKITGPRAFMNNNIEELKLNSIEYIPVGTFRNNNLKKVSMQNVETIKSNSFLGNKIENLYAPNVRIIENSAFSNNELSSLELGEVTEVGANAFRDNKLTNLTLEKVVKIDASAFLNNAITSLSAPNVIEIGPNAFRNNKLTELVLENVKTIESSAFVGNEINLLNTPNLERVGKFAFSDNLIETVLAPNLKEIEEYSLRMNNLSGIELNALPDLFYDNSFSANDTAERLGFFAFYIDGFEENHILDGYRVVVNPNDNFFDGLVGELDNNLTYITILPKYDENHGFATGIDKDNDYYYCVSMYTLFASGVFKGHEITDSVYVIQHGNSGNTQHDVDLPVQKQLVSIDEEPDEFIYSYTGELMSKLIYHLNKKLVEYGYDNQFDNKPAYFVNLISSNLELGNQINLNSQNALNFIEQTSQFKQLENEYGAEFINQLFTRIKEDNRTYTNSFYYTYVPDHKLSYEDDSQPLLKPGVPLNEITEITVDKIWVGGPGSYPEIEVGLYQNDLLIDTIQLNESSWSYTWDKLPVTDEFGVKYEYRIDEIEVPDGYQKSIQGSTIINTYEPEEPPVNTPEEPPVNTPEEPSVNTPNLPSTGSVDIGLIGLFMILIGIFSWILNKE